MFFFNNQTSAESFFLELSLPQKQIFSFFILSCVEVNNYQKNFGWRVRMGIHDSLDGKFWKHGFELMFEHSVLGHVI